VPADSFVGCCVHARFFMGTCAQSGWDFIEILYGEFGECGE
jgi:hypothetical protein